MDHLDAAKIKFTIQQETYRDIPTLNDNIAELLIKEGYKVIMATTTKIEFDYSGDNNWSARQKGFKMMEEGRVEILISEKGTTIQLTYYISGLFDAVLLSICLLGAIFGTQAAFVIGPLLLIQFLLKIYMIKGVANSILLNIILLPD